jgi:hypothetical protein
MAIRVRSISLSMSPCIAQGAQPRTFDQQSVCYRYSVVRYKDSMKQHGMTRIVRYRKGLQDIERG